MNDPSQPPTTSTCSTCGCDVDLHDRDVRFRLPDPVLDLPDRDSTAGTWMSGDDPNGSVFLEVPGAGSFCRCLLQVRLDGGYAVTFGVWVAVPPADLRRAFELWWEPAYEDLVLDGLLANALPGFGGLGSPVEALVRDPDHTPYVASSSDPELQQVLEVEWPHHLVLPNLPS